MSATTVTSVTPLTAIAHYNKTSNITHLQNPPNSFAMPLQASPSLSQPVLCCYANRSNQIQVARIGNVPNWYFERVVFPGERLLFEAIPEACLEIHTGAIASAILSDTISCKRLQTLDAG